MKRLNDRFLTLTIAALGMGTAACASAAPYNPDSLSGDQIARVAQICQTTMGLKTSEPPVSGVHPGAPHLDTYISHYQGCIASLSDTVQRMGDVDATRRADADCRAKGLPSGGAELAMCVLKTANDYATAGTSANAGRPLVPAEAAATHAGSFFYASPHETRQRERAACAQLGLEPVDEGFDHCVKNLETTFFAIDNPLD